MFKATDFPNPGSDCSQVEMFRAAARVRSGVEEGDLSHFLQCEEISRSSLLQFKQSGRLSDVILDVFGKRIKAHKVSKREKF